MRAGVRRQYRTAERGWKKKARKNGLERGRLLTQLEAKDSLSYEVQNTFVSAEKKTAAQALLAASREKAKMRYYAVGESGTLLLAREINSAQRDSVGRVPLKLRLQA